MSPPKVIIVSYSESKGGAAKAASNFFKLIEGEQDYEAMFLSKSKLITKDKTLRVSANVKCYDFILMLFSRMLLVLQVIKFKTKYSLNLFSSLFVSRTLSNNITHKDIVNFHWINNDTLSIEKMAKCCGEFKTIITLHDEWFYSGASHYCSIDDERWRESRIKIDPLRILDSVNFFRKKRCREAFKKAVFTVPSKWMLQRVKQSMVLSDCESYLIPNPVDTNAFKYLKPSAMLQNKLNHKIDKEKYFYICFGAVNGSKNELKGFSLLIEALKIISNCNDKPRIPYLLIFGADNTPSEATNLGIDYCNLGVLKSKDEIASSYSLAHVTVVPSLLESFGQVAAESLSCETPVVCFETSGLTDIVLHKENGYLANPFSSKDLAAGISYFLNISEKSRREFGRRGREHIVENFDCKIVSDMYMNLIDKVRCKNV